MRRLRLPALLLPLLLWSGTATAQAGARERIDRDVADARASMQIDPAKAQAAATRAEATVAAIADPVVRGTLRATALWLDGEASSRLKQINRATDRLGQALKLARRYAPGSKLEGDVLLSSGSAASETGDVVAALTQYQRAHTIFLRIKDARNRAMALIYMAALYAEANDYNAGLKYLDQALAAYDGDPGLLISMQNNRASVLRNLGRHAEAERGFRKALVLAGQMHSPTLEAQILRNIARAQIGQRNLAGAERTIERGEAVARGTDSFNRQAISAMAAEVALQRGQVNLAATLIGRSFEGVDVASTPYSFREAHDTAQRVYRALGRDKDAYVHLRALKRIDDQATRVATTTGAALMAARFDFANQELRIARLKADDLERRVATARVQAQAQRTFIGIAAIATAVVIAALLTGLVVVRRSRNRVRAANADFALANEALGKALAAKTEFLATTSHEIRTPLNGILGMTQVMLADPDLAAPLRERLAVVQGAGTTMRALVDDILDVAKMENGKLVLESAPFDLHATILDATRLWEVQADAKGIRFVRTLDECPATVSGDGSRVRQVVFNLLSNALKFTDSGEIAISARRDDAGRIAIAVRDSGIGIPPEKLEAIFESFRQADAGTTRRFGGTGLGLAICRQLARAMGGDVRVESRLGEGSVFTVTLPLAAVEPIAVAADSEGGADALLIVDRNPIARSLFRTLLEPHAGTVLFAGSAEEADERLRAGGVSRVLVDEATVRAGGDPDPALRRIAAAAGRADITLLWPEVDATARAALLATGVHQILCKPVSGPSLVAALFRDRNDPLVRRAA